MQAELLKHEGWKIDPATRFLVYKEGSPEERVISSYIKDRELQLIYVALGLEMWGEVGEDDLLDPNFITEH
tara:strand:- start:18822 stop:19034 length:213 start_codon:yes stop_codon:yes gene_type:complete